MIECRENPHLPQEYIAGLARFTREKAAAATSLERVVAALRIENARLTRELAEAAAVTARLRTRIAALERRADPSPEYDAHDAPTRVGRVPGAITQRAAKEGTIRGWLVDYLREVGCPVTIDRIMAATGRSRQAVHNAVNISRALIVKSQRGGKHRTFWLKPGA